MNYKWDNLTPNQEKNVVDLLKGWREVVLALDKEDGSAVILTDVLVALGIETKEQAKKLFPKVNF